MTTEERPQSEHLEDAEDEEGKWCEQPDAICPHMLWTDEGLTCSPPCNPCMMKEDATADEQHQMTTEEQPEAQSRMVTSTVSDELAYIAGLVRFREQHAQRPTVEERLDIAPCRVQRPCASGHMMPLAMFDLAQYQLDEYCAVCCAAEEVEGDTA